MDCLGVVEKEKPTILNTINCYVLDYYVAVTIKLLLAKETDAPPFVYCRRFTEVPTAKINNPVDVDRIDVLYILSLDEKWVEAAEYLRNKLHGLCILNCNKHFNPDRLINNWQKSSDSWKIALIRDIAHSHSKELIAYGDGRVWNEPEMSEKNMSRLTMLTANCIRQCLECIAENAHDSAMVINLTIEEDTDSKKMNKLKMLYQHIVKKWYCNNSKLFYAINGWWYASKIDENNFFPVELKRGTVPMHNQTTRELLALSNGADAISPIADSSSADEIDGDYFSSVATSIVEALKLLMGHFLRDVSKFLTKHFETAVLRQTTSKTVWCFNCDVELNDEILECFKKMKAIIVYDSSGKKILSIELSDTVAFMWNEDEKMITA